MLHKCAEHNLSDTVKFPPVILTTIDLPASMSVKNIPEYMILAPVVTGKNEFTRPQPMLSPVPISCIDI